MAQMMWSQLPPTRATPIPSISLATSTTINSPTFNLPSLQHHVGCFTLKTVPHNKICLASTKLKASTEDVGNLISTAPLLQQDHPNQEVEESIRVLKNAAKTKKVDKNEILAAFSVIEKAKLDPSKFLETLGGTKSPGRTWMLIFTAEKKLKGGRYFPLTAVQRFDAKAKRIENGVYLGPLGSLSFEGKFSWKNRILAFIFECVRIKIGPFNPLQIDLGNQDNREPNTKDPFFIWFYVDEEIAVARGRGGGTAFWCRCSRVTSPRISLELAPKVLEFL